MVSVFLKIAFKKTIVVRALIVALIVGFLLNLINQGNLIFSMHLAHLNISKLLLTFIVPYLVSTISSVLGKISMHPGDVANVSAKIKCNGCGKNEIDIVKGEWIPFCNTCGKSSKWKIIKLLPDNIALHEHSEKSLALFARYNPNPVIRIDHNYQIVACNSLAGLNFVNYFKIGDPVSKFIPGLNLNMVKECILHGTVMQHNEPGDKKYLHFEIRGLPELKSAQIYTADITELMKTRKKVSSMALFADLNPEPVFRFDRNKILIEANPAALDVFSEFRVGESVGEILSFLIDMDIKHLIDNDIREIKTAEINSNHIRFMIRGISSLNVCQVYSSDITKLVEAEKKIRSQAKNIESSIRYASRIQESLLPSENRFKNLIPENFILFKPRDIVSGDFYWISEQNNKIILTAADCTGHGVPGSLMSMLGIAFLNQIIASLNVFHPDEVLNLLRDKVIQTLSAESTEAGLKDGMDMALCVIDKEAKKISYAGANNPLWIIRNGEFIEYKADRMPVGRFIKEHIPFTSQKISFQDGDRIYIFSDGYHDQIGGEQFRKMTKKGFREKLLEIYKLPFKEQKHELEEHLKDWQKGFFQVDDILVVGFTL